VKHEVKLGRTKMDMTRLICGLILKERKKMQKS